MKLTEVHQTNPIITSKDKLLIAVMDPPVAEVVKTIIMDLCKTLTETVSKETVMVEWEVFQLQVS